MAKQPKTLSPIEWAAGWLKQETEVVMKFLATPLEELDQHASYAAYIYGKYAAMLTNLEEKWEELRDERKLWENQLIKQVCETTDAKGTPYSVAYAERKITENKRLQSLIDQERKAKYAALKVKRYLVALDMKANSIPGKQGLYNRTVQHEEKAEQ